MDWGSLAAAVAAVFAAISAWLSFRQAAIANRLTSVAVLDTFLERARHYQDAWLEAFISGGEHEINLKKIDLFNHLEVTAIALNANYYPKKVAPFIEDAVLGTVAHFEARSDIAEFGPRDIYGGLLENLATLCAKHRAEIDRRKERIAEAP